MSTNWARIKERAISEYADPLTMLADLSTAIRMSLDGMQQEKSTVKGDVVTVTEVQPSAVANLVRTQLEVLKYIDSQTTVETAEECKLVIGAWFNNDKS